MKPRSGRSWFLGAVGVFFTLMVVWAAGAFRLSSASAGSLPFGIDLRSKLAADYSGDEGGEGLFGFLRLTLFEEVFRDAGIGPDEAEGRAAAIREALQGEVPTATALNFDGDAPFTATPTWTFTPTNTPVPTATATATHTSTPSPTATATAKPTATATPKPTKPPASPVPSKTPSKTPAATSTLGAPTATHTSTPTSTADTSQPVILSGADLNPAPGTLSQCSISISNQRVTDAAPSSGMDWVKLKYEDPDNPGSYIFSSPLSLKSGGPAGGGWDGIYEGSIDISSVAAGETIPLWVKARDNAGNSSFLYLGDYTLAVDCP